MEKLLTGELNTVTLLAAIILGLLTRRIVPWWIYEDVVNKLKVYEENAPELITEVRRLTNLLRDEKKRSKDVVDATPYRTVHVNKKRK